MKSYNQSIQAHLHLETSIRMAWRKSWRAFHPPVTKSRRSRISRFWLTVQDPTMSLRMVLIIFRAGSEMRRHLIRLKYIRSIARNTSSEPKNRQDVYMTRAQTKSRAALQRAQTMKERWQMKNQVEYSLFQERSQATKTSNSVQDEENDTAPAKSSNSALGPTNRHVIHQSDCVKFARRFCYAVRTVTSLESIMTSFLDTSTQGRGTHWNS